MIAAPFIGQRGVVRPDWLSAGTPHLNLAYYLVLFHEGSLALFEALGIGKTYREETGQACFASETHLVYEQEMKLGDTAMVATTLLDADDRRLHFAHEMFRPDEDRRVCLQELLFVNVDTRTSRAASWTEAARERIGAALAAHAVLPHPAKTGRSIGIKRA
jgi:acyl-CoA thioester hydrolase